MHELYDKARREFNEGEYRKQHLIKTQPFALNEKNAYFSTFLKTAAFYYTSRGNTERYSNLAVEWRQLELVKYNVPEIMKDMKKPYLVISGENAWPKPASTEVYDAVPANKEMHIIPEAGHFGLYDLAPLCS